MKKMYGRSLSFCVSDILDNKVSLKRVGGIVTSTKFDSPKQILDSDYPKIYWSRHSLKRIESVLNALWESGRIIQPRKGNDRLSQALYKYPNWGDSLQECMNSLEEM